MGVSVTNYILTLPTEPPYSYETELDGETFKLLFKYSTRELCWCLSLYSLAGDLLLSNCRLTPWLDLLNPYVDAALPKGALALIPVSTDYPQSPLITLDNLSTDFQLFYLSIE